jgi:hypothetical protein
MNYEVLISIDPGCVGAIAIFEQAEPKIYRMPVKKVVINKKDKKIYDLEGICSLFKPYENKKVIMAQEKVGVMPGQGNVSGFSFGESVMATKAIGVAYGFSVLEIRPVAWKAHYPELETAEIAQDRENLKALKNEAKELAQKSKTIKDKDLKNTNKEIIKKNKKEQEKIGRHIKSSAKAASRILAAQLYPNLKDNFKQVNSDGLSEAVLIGRYVKDNYDKLV